MEKNKKEVVKDMLQEGETRSMKNADKNDLLKQRFEEAINYYIKYKSARLVKEIFQTEGFFYYSDENTYTLKHDFIVTLMGHAVEKNDKEFQDYLKSIAEKFDKEFDNSSNSLYLDIVNSYPAMLSKSDLKWLVDNVKGRQDKFKKLLDFIMDYINPNTPPEPPPGKSPEEDVLNRFNFLWEILKEISYKGEDWAPIGEMYLDRLFADEYVSFGIFSVDFFKNYRARTFLNDVKKYRKKYLRGSRFDLANSEIIDHYTKAMAKEKKRKKIIFASVFGALIACGIGVAIFFNSVDKSSIELHGDLSEVLIYAYGEEPDLSNYYITYKKYSGVECREQVTYKMLEGIGKTNIGKQQVISITFKGKTFESCLQVRIDPTRLDAPVVTRQRTNVSWNLVTNATGYEVYVENKQITQPTGTPKVTVGENVKTADIAEYCQSGIYSYVYVRAVYKDGDSDDANDLYDNSVLSNEIKIKKLDSVSNVNLDNDVLTWDAVEGVTAYEIKFGDNKFEATEPRLEYAFVGGEEITISTNNKSEDDLDSSATFKLLEKVSSIVYEGNFIKCQGNTSTYDITITKRGEETPVITLSNTTAKTVDVSNSATYPEGVYQVSVRMHGEGSNISSPAIVKYFAIGVETTVSKSGDISKITWSSGLGKSYKVTIQDKLVADEITTNEYEIKESDFTNWGDYTVSVVAIDSDSNEIYLRSSTITKVKEPKLEYNKTSSLWSNVSTSANQSVKYKVNGAEVSTLPTTFDAGVVYTISATIVTANTNEVNSNATEVTIYKLENPQIKVDYSTGTLAPINQLQNGIEIKYYVLSGENRTQISDLNSLGGTTEYRIVGVLTSDNYNNYTYVLDSGDSTEIKVQRYASPTVDDYNNEDFVYVGGTRTGYSFYYKKSSESDESYQPLQNGQVGNLSAGTYNIYAVKNGALEGGIYYLDSGRSDILTISKANILFTVSFVNNADKQTVRIVFSNGSDTNPFSYKITYYSGDDTFVQTSTGEVSLSEGNNVYTVKKPNSVDASQVTKITVEITMDTVAVSKSWEKS